MNLLDKVPTSITRAMGSAKLTLKRNEPSICLAAGIGLTLASVAYTAYQTYKKAEKYHDVCDTLAKQRVEIESHKSYYADDAEELVKAHRVMLKNGAIDIVKTYALPVAMLGGGIFLICRSHGLMLDRFNQQVALLNTTTAAFSAYRQRVKDKYGEEAEADIWYGESEVEIDTGNKKKGKAQVREALCDGFIYGPDLAPNWMPRKSWESPVDDPNLLIFRNAERMANRKLDRVGYVMFADLLQSLGIYKNFRNAQTLGWSYDLNPASEVHLTITPGYLHDDAFYVEATCSDDTRSYFQAEKDPYVYWIEPNVDGDVVDCLPNL